MLIYRPLSTKRHYCQLLTGWWEVQRGGTPPLLLRIPVHPACRFHPYCRRAPHSLEGEEVVVAVGGRQWAHRGLLMWVKSDQLDPPRWESSKCRPRFLSLFLGKLIVHLLLRHSLSRTALVLSYPHQTWGKLYSCRKVSPEIGLNVGGGLVLVLVPNQSLAPCSTWDSRGKGPSLGLLRLPPLSLL